MQKARKSQRRTLALAVELDSKEKRGRVGILRNISRSGLLINTPTLLEHGSDLELRVHQIDGTTARLRAKVARVEECGPRSHEPWRYRVGLELKSAWYDLMGRQRSAKLFAQAC